VGEDVDDFGDGAGVSVFAGFGRFGASVGEGLARRASWWAVRMARMADFWSGVRARREMISGSAKT
jgi:hypothetical protein